MDRIWFSLFAFLITTHRISSSGNKYSGPEFYLWVLMFRQNLHPLFLVFSSSWVVCQDLFAEKRLVNFNYDSSRMNLFISTFAIYGWDSRSPLIFQCPSNFKTQISNFVIAEISFCHLPLWHKRKGLATICSLKVQVLVKSECTKYGPQNHCSGLTNINDFSWPGPCLAWLTRHPMQYTTGNRNHPLLPIAMM